MTKLQKYEIGLLAILFVGIFALETSCSATTINASSCSQMDVQAAITSANEGDTVVIPSGTCTWKGSLQSCGASSYQASVCVTKNITLTGAGAENTIIKNDETTPDQSGILYSHFIYHPANPSTTAPFEIENITWDMNGTHYKPMDFVNTIGSVLQQLKIHDNIFSKCDYCFYFAGAFKGVIYENTISTNPGGQVQQNRGAGVSEWTSIRKCVTEGNCAHDDGNNLYWEDNIVNSNEGFLESGGGGFSWVARYNTINYTRAVPMFDWHGNYSTYGCSAMDMAVYGNYMHYLPTDAGVGKFAVPRGGMGLIFNNYCDQSTDWSISIWNEAEETSGDCDASVTGNPQPQHVSDTYAWNNINSKESIPSYEELYDLSAEIAENSEYFLQRSGPFDGTGADGHGGGVGCGTLANLPVTCTKGVGYWATGQSCTDLSKSVGAHPSTPISGTLYKCTAPNVWTAYYTPYTYPHPLRNEPDITPPASPTGLVVH